MTFLRDPTFLQKPEKNEKQIEFGGKGELFEIRLKTTVWRILSPPSPRNLLTVRTSVRPKPLFWFRYNTDTETQIGQYFRADTVTDTETRFQGENPVTNFFYHQRAPKTKFVAKY